MVDSHINKAADWWLRPLRPSDLLVWAVGQWRDMTGGGGKDFAAGLVVAGIAAWLWLLPSPGFALTAISLAAACGVLLTLTVARRGPLGWITTRAAVASTALGQLVGFLLLFLAEQPRLASLWALLAAEVLSRRPAHTEARPLEDRWYAFNTLRDALVTAGIKGSDGSLLNLSYKGKMRRDSVGEWQKVALPAPITHEEVAAKRKKIAGALGLPAHRLHVEHDRNDPETWVTFAVLNDRKAITASASLPERTDWAQPVSLGVDRLGRAEEFRTTNVHSAIVAATGAGKTWTVRYLLSHALLDPRVPIALISGKDDPEDWQPMRNLCVRYAGGAGRETVEEALSILKWVEQVSAYRQTLPKDQRIPMVLVVDEWFLLQQSAARISTALGKEVAGLFAELAATVRSRNIHMMVLLQKGTEDYLPTSQRANFLQKIVGMTERPSETRYVLGDLQPEVLPSSPGEFLVYRAGREPALVHVPTLTDDAFLEVCERAGRLRSDEKHPDALELAGQQAAVVDVEPVVEPDELELAVWRVLKRQGPLPASRLWDLLPEDVRLGGPVPLGKRLRRMGGVRQVSVGEGKRTQAWEFVPQPARLPVAVPADEQPVPAESAVATPAPRGYLPPGMGSDGGEGAATGTSDAVPPVLRAVP